MQPACQDVPLSLNRGTTHRHTWGMNTQGKFEHLMGDLGAADVFLAIMRGGSRCIAVCLLVHRCLDHLC